MWSVFLWPGVKLEAQARPNEDPLRGMKTKERFMNTQLEYYLIMMNHRQLLAEAERDRRIHGASRQPSRLKTLWMAMRKRTSELRAGTEAVPRRSLEERSA